MTTEPKIEAHATLTAEQQAQAHALAATCNQLEGLDLKVATEFPATAHSTERNAFLCSADDTLIGYCALDRNSATEAELCGMVAPAHRRRGIGGALLAAVRAESQRTGLRRLLIICEQASQSGRAFVATTGARLTFSEYRLVLGTLVRRPPAVPDLTLTLAGPADADAVAHVTAVAFGDPEDLMQARIRLDIHDLSQRFYVARLGGEAVATLKVYPYDIHTAGIYAFGVLPGRRGRGIGRQVLTEICARLQAEGRTRILLEVETTNTTAHALYRSCGFEERTTYGYYALDVPQA
ncbi:MAG TPA: GNAT family N-acetyltransferase [Ktedonobacterales bacterium]